MGYFHVRYDSRVINYGRRGFIRLATGLLFRRGDSKYKLEGFAFESQRWILDGYFFRINLL